MHVHRREDEQFLLLEGEARFVVDDAVLDVRAGDAVMLPRDVPHGYVVTSEQARLVGSVTPAGFEAFFARLGTPVVAGEPEAPPPAPEKMAGMGPELGIEILGPPPAL
jgi:hypothetical protein